MKQFNYIGSKKAPIDSQSTGALQLLRFH